MSTRGDIQEIIVKHKELGNVSLVARKLHISRSTVYRWLRRGRSIYTPHYVSWRGLKRRSTKPKKVYRALSLKDEFKVYDLRQQTGFDSRKLALELKKRHNLCVSPSTVYRALKRTRPELLRTVAAYRRPRFQNGKAMRPRNTRTTGYLQADVKYVTPELSGLPHTTYEYAFIDIYSRYKLALILPVLDEAGSTITLKWVLKDLPFKIKYIQTDNGLEFQSSFHQLCRENNITHYHIHKNSPNENAVVERSFRTDQEEFFFRLDEAPEDVNQLNSWFQVYLSRYNTHRPHFGIDLKTPLEVVESVSKVVKH